ncbi:hypothetical protein VP501E541_P0101 [Vibrio phage 501E54-1]|nr:hypothetical protein VP501E541_P0101 [Vibrio phage 501E54-1]
MQNILEIGKEYRTGSGMQYIVLSFPSQEQVEVEITVGAEEGTVFTWFVSMCQRDWEV